MDFAPENGSRDADRAYLHLRKQILTLELAPGSVLDEARIVRQLAMSRTPVREAVIRLVSEGLLKRDGRQVVVPTFQVRQLKAFFEALTLLSRATHRMAAERRSAAQLATIRAAQLAFEVEVKRGDETSMNDTNHAFHRAISWAADSMFIQESYGSILLESLRLSRQCFVPGSSSEYAHHEHIGRIVSQHAAISDAIERQDADEADWLAAAHSDLFRGWLSQQLLGPSVQVTEMALAN